MKQQHKKENWKKLLDRELEKIVNVLKQKYKPKKIIIFGSVNSGYIKEWSDLDFVIIKETNKRFYDRISEVSGLITHKVPVDFLVYTPEEFKKMAKDNYFIRDEVIARGKTIYAS